jgi:2,3-bisphosphoglycerate-dependent phosphoglycerate mutase|tara:strand:- start:5516 stop:6205 length:690 start_codon:yes stop_codon:yes gene_type:complete
MNNLILVRHGQSIWNKEKRFTGWADVDLTAQGMSEAELAGNLIKKLGINFDICFTSKLKRAVNTLEIILKVLNRPNIDVVKSDLLNERHYGGLTSLNKDETIQKYGAKQVQVWRRSFDIPPPPMDSNNPYKDKIKSNILSESLKDTFNRVIPFYNDKIKPLVISKKNILVVFHGNSCRSLLKEILNISNENIIQLEVPTGNPLQIIFDTNLKLKKINYLDKSREKKIIF